MLTIKSKVFKRNGETRDGKGFSIEELRKAGSNHKEALKLDVPVDFKRRTAHEENIEALKTFFKTRKSASKPKAKPKS